MSAVSPPTTAIDHDQALIASYTAAQAAAEKLQQTAKALVVNELASAGIILGTEVPLVIGTGIVDDVVLEKVLDQQLSTLVVIWFRCVGRKKLANGSFGARRGVYLKINPSEATRRMGVGGLTLAIKVSTEE